MKKTIQLVLALTTGLILSINSNATQMLGVNITYKHITAKKYEFKIVAVRDCGGVALSNMGLSFRVKSAGASSIIFMPLQRKSITDITPLCNSEAKPCSPANTYGTGAGFEQHIFIDTIDFAADTFQHAPWDTACEIIIGTGQCCRSGDITTGQANANYYTEIWFNRCQAAANSNPVSHHKNAYIVYCQNPFYNYLTNTDADGDSLSYELAPQLSNVGTTINYSSGQNCNRLLSASEPLSTFLTKPCLGNIPSPFVDPPIGFYLGTNDALCAFTPTNCNELTTITYQVTEHRKNTNGIYEIIGQSRKDFIVRVVSVSNHPPKIIANKSYNVVAGSTFELPITIKDDPYIPPPPDTSLQAPDTVTIFWDSGIANATFIVNDSGRLPNAIFKWTPSCNDVSNRAYTFNVIATDSFCPYPAEVSKEIQIKVIASPPVNLGADRNVCEGVNVTLGSNFNYKSYLWSTNDTTPSIVATAPGDYWLRTISYCGDTTFDTVKAIHHTKPIVKLPNDTTLCIDNTYDVSATAPNAVSYNWNTGQSTNQITIDTAGFYEITVTDKYCGTFKDDINITNLLPPASVSLGMDRPYCKDVNKTLTAPDDGISTFLWSTGKKTASIFVTKPDVYWVTVTNVCGVEKDTIDFSDTTSINLNLGADTLVCDKGSYTITSNIDADEYVWNTFDNKKSITANQPGEYILRVDKCQQRAFDTIVVDFKETPMPNLGADQQLDTPFSIVLDAGVTADEYLWSTNDDTKTISITEGGIYWVDATNECGTGRDSITILVNSIVNNSPIAESIKVYPNPIAGNELTVNFTGAERQIVQLSLIALTGEEVYAEKINISGNTTHTIKVNELPAGIYFLQVSSTKGKATIKIVVK